MFVDDGGEKHKIIRTRQMFRNPDDAGEDAWRLYDGDGAVSPVSILAFQNDSEIQPFVLYLGKGMGG